MTAHSTESIELKAATEARKAAEVALEAVTTKPDFTKIVDAITNSLIDIGLAAIALSVAGILIANSNAIGEMIKGVKVKSVAFGKDGIKVETHVAEVVNEIASSVEVQSEKSVKAISEPAMGLSQDEVAEIEQLISVEQGRKKVRDVVTGKAKIQRVKKGRAIWVTLPNEKSSVVEVPIKILEEDRKRLINRISFFDKITQNRKILWVDDHPENNSREVNLLQGMGVDVIRVKTNEAALELLETDAFDLILSDIDRGAKLGAKGLDLPKKVRDAGFETPIVFYITNLYVDKSTPTYAHAITNRMDELAHLVMDIFARSIDELPK